MTTSTKMLSLLLLTLGLSLSLTAQDEAPEARRNPPPVMIAAEDNSPSPDEAVPDTRPVTGVLPLTVGAFGTERSFFSPSFQFLQTVDTNPAVTIGQSDPVAVTNMAGNAQLQRVWRQSQFSANATVGGSIYAGDSDLNTAFEAVQLQQVFQFRRWSLTLADNVSDTPESAFGFSGLSAFGGFNFTTATAPNQSILTSHGRQISNTALGQMNYALNSRSSFTVSGNFGILRYSGPELLDSDQGGFQVGYNYALNPRDFLGVSYGLNLIRYPGISTPESLNSHNLQLAYAHKVTGRLAVRVSGGPQINQTTLPPMTAVTEVGWLGQSSLIFRFRKSELQFGYSHGVTAGAGVLGLAKNDQVQGNLTSRLTRTLTASFTAGYAHNTNLQEVVASPTPAFNTEFVSVGLNRPVGHEANLLFNYAFQHQSTNVLSCNLGLCGNDLDRHIVGVGFQWHMRPMLIH